MDADVIRDCFGAKNIKELLAGITSLEGAQTQALTYQVILLGEIAAQRADLNATLREEVKPKSIEEVFQFPENAEQRARLAGLASATPAQEERCGCESTPGGKCIGCRGL